MKLRGVLSGAYLSVYSHGKCSACTSGLLKEQILSMLALKKFKAFLEGEKAKVRESNVKGEEQRRSFSLQGQRAHSIKAQSWLSQLIFIHAHVYNWIQKKNNPKQKQNENTKKTQTNTKPKNNSTKPKQNTKPKHVSWYTVLLLLLMPLA